MNLLKINVLVLMPTIRNIQHFHVAILATIILGVLGIIVFYQWRKLPRKKTIYVIFRYDDYSTLSHTDLEVKIMEICRKHRIVMTFAVVPFVIEGDVHDPLPRNVIPLSSEKVQYIKDGIRDGILDIALHGYSHQTNNKEQFSEFAGLGYEAQVRRLEKGKQFLENNLDSAINIFVPPWNAYDLNTLQALKALRFSTVSADRMGVATKESRMKFLPCTCSLRRLKDSAIQNARITSDPTPVIVVLFHEFEFLDIDEKRGMVTMKEFVNLVSWLKAQNDIRILSISQATKAIRDLSARRFLVASQQSAMYRKQPT